MLANCVYLSVLDYVDDCNENSSRQCLKDNDSEHNERQKNKTNRTFRHSCLP